MERIATSAFNLPKSQDNCLVCVPPPSVHPTPYLTGGLQQLYQKVKDSKNLQNCDTVSQDCSEYTDQDGCFCPKPGMPPLASRYHYVESIGKGQSSILLKAKDTFRGDELVSIKVLHSHYSMLGVQEMDCLRRLNKADRSGVSATLKFYTAFRFGSHCCLVFELLHPTPLMDYFSTIVHTPLALQQIRNVTVHLLFALGFLQQQNVLHADLKPENLLLKSDNDMRSVKLVDFGNALHCVYDELSLYYDDFEVQTLLYRAPEVVFGIPFGMEIDMWSLGCILAELYTGKPLFASKSKRSLIKKMSQLLGPLPQELFQRGKFYQEYSPFVAKNPPHHDVVRSLMAAVGCRDQSFGDLLAGLLKYNPAERLTVCEAAMHPFLAPELPLRFLMSQYISGEKTHYPQIQLTPQSYTKKPHIDVDKISRHLSSIELLRQGSTGSGLHDEAITLAIPRKVAQVVPQKREAASPDTVQETNSTVQREPQWPTRLSSNGTTITRIVKTGSRKHTSDLIPSTGRCQSNKLKLAGGPLCSDRLGDLHSRDALSPTEMHPSRSRETRSYTQETQSVHFGSLDSRDTQRGSSRDKHLFSFDQLPVGDLETMRGSYCLSDSKGNFVQQQQPVQPDTLSDSPGVNEPTALHEQAQQHLSYQEAASSSNVQLQALGCGKVQEIIDDEFRGRQYQPRLEDHGNHGVPAEVLANNTSSSSLRAGKLQDIMRLIREEQQKVEAEEDSWSSDVSLVGSPCQTPEAHCKPEYSHSHTAICSSASRPAKEEISTSYEYPAGQAPPQRGAQSMKMLGKPTVSVKQELDRTREMYTMQGVLHSKQQYHKQALGVKEESASPVVCNQSLASRTNLQQPHKRESPVTRSDAPQKVPKPSSQAVKSHSAGLDSEEDDFYAKQADSTLWFHTNYENKLQKNAKGTKDQVVSGSEEMKQMSPTGTDLEGHTVKGKLNSGSWQLPGRTYVQSVSDHYSEDSDSENVSTAFSDESGEILRSGNQFDSKASLTQTGSIKKPSHMMHISDHPAAHVETGQKMKAFVSVDPSTNSHQSHSSKTPACNVHLPRYAGPEVRPEQKLKCIYTVASSTNKGMTPTCGYKHATGRLSPDHQIHRPSSSSLHCASSTRQLSHCQDSLSSPVCTFHKLKAIPKKKLRERANTGKGVPASQVSKRRKVEECGQRGGSSRHLPSAGPSSIRPSRTKKSPTGERRSPDQCRTWGQSLITVSRRQLNWQRVANSEGATTSDEDPPDNEPDGNCPPSTQISPGPGKKYQTREARTSKRTRYSKRHRKSSSEDFDDADFPSPQTDRSPGLAEKDDSLSGRYSESDSSVEDRILLL